MDFHLNIFFNLVKIVAVDTDLPALCYKLSYMKLIVRNCLKIEKLSAFTVKYKLI